jgi:hypothetical protein
MRGARVLVAALVMVVVAALCAGSVEARPAAAPARSRCPLGSDQLRDAQALTLQGLDPGVFTSFRVGEPPPIEPGSESGTGHYSGPLWTYATVAGSQGASTDDVSGIWEASLAQGAIAERCSLGVRGLERVMGGSSTRFATGKNRDDWGGQGTARAGEVFPAEASGEPDAAIITDAERVLKEFGLTPRTVRVLRPLGPALLVTASTGDVASVQGRMGDLEDALDGGPGRPEFEGLYLAVDGPRGPLFRGQGTWRTGSGGQWFAEGFDSGIPHG